MSESFELKQMAAAIDQFGAAHVSSTAYGDDDEPVFFVLVSKDTETIKDLKKLIDDYDNEGV